MVAAMRFLPRFLPLAVVLVLLAGVFSSTSPVARAACTGERFSDVCPSDWFYPYVMDLSMLNNLAGYDDGTFKPYNRMTRGQAMKVIVLALALTQQPPASPTFADVPTTTPFYPWVEIGAALGLASGYDCGSSAAERCDAQQRPYFRPNGEVNRGQLAKMIVLARGWTPLTPTTATFVDVDANNVFFGAIERAAANGLVSGYDDGSFRPFGPVTRAQAAKIIDLGRRWTPATATATEIPVSGTPTRTRVPASATPSRTTVAASATPSHTPQATATATRPAPSATATATQTSGSGPTVAGCPVFPADNIWNRNIASLPVNRRSAQYIASIGASTGVHPDFGAGEWDGGPIGIPYTTVPANQPGVNVTFDYDDQSDRPPYPVPTDAPIEGGPNSDGDRHVLIVQQGACVLHELYYSYPQDDGSWTAGSGARWNLNSNALRPDVWTSADAAGLPIFPGLARYEEVAAGAIHHALRFTAPETQQAYIWPARHQASDNTDTNLPPMGLRVRLKANVNIATYSPQVRIVLQALKDYGAFLADNGSPWYISGIPNPGWNDDDLVDQLRNIHGADFEAVDESSLMIDPDSGASR